METKVFNGMVYRGSSPNNKYYIGQTTQKFEVRKKEHLRDVKNGSTYAIHNALRLYGKKFMWEVLEQNISHINKLNWLEEFYIDYFDTFLGTFLGSGYNMTSGGGNALHSEETRKKMSKARKGMRFSEEHKRKIGIANKMRIMKDSTRRKISKAKKGKYIGEKNPFFDKKHSEESLRKMSLSSLNISNETRNKMSLSHKGVKLSEEHKRKIGLAGIGNNYAKTRAVIIECTHYNSITQAAKKLNIRHDTLCRRLKSKSDKFKNWNYTTGGLT